MRYLLSLLGILILSSQVYASEVVTYEDGEAKLEGYLAIPEEGEGPFPAILIAHQWKGLGEYEKSRADMLADMGYIAFAVDVYGQGIRPETIEAAKTESKIYKDDPKLARSRMNAALDLVRALPEVNKEKIAALGYCFGGTMALELARDEADIDGVISFHGGLASADQAQNGDKLPSILIHNGAADPHVKSEEIENFKAEMRRTNTDWQFIEYADAVHAFTEKAAGDDPSTGAAYNEKADKRSWAYTLEFLDMAFADKQSN